MTLRIKGDEHPDELLDRAAAGKSLSTGERAALAEHLRRCEVCSFLRAVKADLHRESTPAKDRARAAALVTATLAALPATGLPRAAREASSRWRPGPSPIETGPRAARRAAGPGAFLRRSIALAAALVLGLGGLALAGYWKRHTGSEPPVGTMDLVQARKGPVIAPVIVTGISPRIAAGIAPGITPDLAPSMAPPPAPSRDAAVLFAEARGARLRGDAAATRELYQRLWERFASTSEGQAGRAVFARWLLDRGEPAAALPVFTDYLRVAPTGPLEEEARVGVAESWELLGRTAEARAAWKRLLLRHPDSAHAAWARARLLGGATEGRDTAAQAAARRGR